MNKNISDYEIDTMLKIYCARRSQIAFDASKEEKKMTKRKGFKIAVTAFALIAILSVGIISNFMFIGNNTAEKQNGFFLVANAAESTADEIKLGNEFKPIAKLTHNKKTTRLIQKVNNGEAGEADFSSILSADCFDLDLFCRGNNINKITYTINGGSFRVKDTKNLTDLKKMYLLGEYDENDKDSNLYDDEYSTYTVDQNKQNMLGKIELVAGAELTAEDVPEAVMRAAGFDESIYRSEIYKNADAVKKDLDEYLDYIFKNLRLKVKVTYSDGSYENKTLAFSAESQVSGFERFMDEDGEYGFDWSTDIDVKAKLI